jgi:hypothetical protein
LVREVGKDAQVNAIFDKAIGVLGHAEFFEPVCNLLRRSHRMPLPRRVFHHANSEFTPDKSADDGIAWPLLKRARQAGQFGGAGA